jgi:hypothetical protein
MKVLPCQDFIFKMTLFLKFSQEILFSILKTFFMISLLKNLGTHLSNIVLIDDNYLLGIAISYLNLIFLRIEFFW